MTINYVLNKNDYLQYHLFAASKNERIKKKRRNTWIMMCIVSFCMSYLFFSSNSDFLGYYFLLTGTLSIFFYPIYQRWHYKRHFKKHIEEQLKNDNEDCEVTFDSQFVSTTGTTGSSKINIDQTEIIYETASYFFLRLKSAQTLIISKSTLKNSNTGSVRNELVNIANALKIEFVSDLNWKWK